MPGGGAAAASSGPGAGEQATLTSYGTAPAAEPASPRTTSPSTDSRLTSAVPALPADSGTGRRVVFDISDQRVWLIGTDSRGADEVTRTYLVSGPLSDNLHPGTYAVYSRSRRAVGVDDSGTMEYFVRFTRGASAAIGFHSIPTKDHRPVQTVAELGTPQSHGCIRQALPDARRLYAFAPVGTKVVVTA